MINCVIVAARQPRKHKDQVTDALSHLSKTDSDRKTLVHIFLLLLFLFILKRIFPISRNIKKFQEYLKKTTVLLNTGKGKGHPAKGRGGPRGSGWIKAPDFLDVSALQGW